MAAAMGLPSSTSRLMYATITTPLSTATPNRAMNPIAAERFRFSPRSHSAAMPPTAAKGTFSRISRACFTELKLENSRMKMIRIASGTTRPRRAMARCWFSNWPP